MPSPRRVVTLVGLVIILLFLYHTLSPTTKDGSTYADETRTRSYPPPRSKDRAQQNVLQDMASRPLRDRLQYYFPYDVESKFPAYIWQTWKSSPSVGDFDERLRRLEASWTEKNPGFVHEVIIDKAAEHLIRYLYASVPEVWEAYMAMPLPVLKADFFRYLILHSRGGIYTDIDTQALKPITEWLPQDLDPNTVGLVVGIEADPDREDWHDWYARRIQFCQWTIQSKPGHPVLGDIIANITGTTLSLKQQGQLLKGRIPSAKSVMEFTGPGAWTDAVFFYLNNKQYWNANKILANTTVDHFFNLKTYKRVGDVMVLPITSFSPGVQQMGAGEQDDPMAFVHHDFDGSWKPEAERMKKTDG